ncbi:MAG: TolC family protein [Bdellovibrionales bacterium]|nr:TolC family protein [Bdellovibrionales bacterium]
MIPKYFVIAMIISFAYKMSFAAGFKSLEEILNLAYKNNPSIAVSQYSLNAEKSLVISKATLDDPTIGVSTLDRNSRTQYGTIIQKIQFPVRYILQAKVQSSRAASFKSKLDMKKLEIRQQVISLYYAIYSTQKIIQLTKANMQTVKEFARVAEKKYAAGKSPQGDSMKAHFELTQLELELMRLRQEEETLQDTLKSVINEHTFEKIDLVNLKITPPKFYSNRVADSLSELTSKLQDKSPTVKTQAHLLKEAEYKSSLSKWKYVPDFYLQYQQRISGVPEDSQSYSIGITVPLWFWKTESESSAASSKLIAQEYHLIDTIQKMIAKVKELKGKVLIGFKTLKIYETSLIPQAQGAYNSIRGAYRANRTSFLDLLDSERSLYRVRTGFYQSLKQYVSLLSELETQLGFTVSDLAMKHEVQK